MDWTGAIETHRTALMRMLSALFALAGIVPGGGETVATLSRRLRSAVFLVLRPAESAARRLIILEAEGLAEQGVAVPLPAVQPITAKPVSDKAKTAKPATTRAFPLIDPRKTFGQRRRRTAAVAPRMFFFDGTDPPIEPPKPASTPDDLIDAGLLCKRLNALHKALDDLPRQAMRLLRMRERQKRGIGKRRLPPMRPGFPPGHRKRHRHEVDETLRACHGLVLWRLEPPDTS